MAQHAGLSAEAWAQVGRDQQLLAIAAEMNRARKRIQARDRAGLTLAYERILNLAELTVEVPQTRALRRELLLWRDVVAALYLEPDPALADHDRTFRALLMLTPACYAQLPVLLT